MVVRAFNFHLVDRSPWPLIVGLGSLNLTIGGALYMHRFILGGWVLGLGFVIVVLAAINWFRDIIREGTYQGFHSRSVKLSLKIGMILFIVSEVMFFWAFFWAYFHSSLTPAIEVGLNWPPMGINLLDCWSIPLLNTALLLASGISVTYAHHSYLSGNLNRALSALGITIVLAVVFTGLQAVEYINSGFTISDSVYGSIFYMSTGFHGLHVTVGAVMLSIQLLRSYNYNFSATRLYGFEASSWYWHFVDVVWLFLFIVVYWWGSVL